MNEKFIPEPEFQNPSEKKLTSRVINVIIEKLTSHGEIKIFDLSNKVLEKSNKKVIFKASNGFTANLNELLPKGWKFEEGFGWHPLEKSKIITYPPSEISSKSVGENLLNFLHEIGHAHLYERPKPEKNSKVIVDPAITIMEMEKDSWAFALQGLRKMEDQGLPLKEYFKNNQEIYKTYRIALDEWKEKLKTDLKNAQQKDKE